MAPDPSSSEVSAPEDEREHGLRHYTNQDGELLIASGNLPPVIPMFMPVFVSGIGIDIDMINFLIKSSFPAIDRLFHTAYEKGADLDTRRMPFLALAETRDPKFVLFPTQAPIAVQDFRLPFLGKSFSNIFAAWVGKDKVNLEDGVAPFRQSGDLKDKPRYWSERVFLILDEETMATRHDPTALVVRLDDDLSDEKDAQSIRCDLPVSLRLMALLEGPAYSVQYFRARLADENGVVRYQKVEDYFKPGGLADQEERANGSQPMPS